MRRLLLVLLVAWPLAARADFVNDNGSLPGVKTDKFPLAIGADPTKYIAAADYNALRDALFSERNAVLNGAMLGLAPTPSPTAVTTVHSNYYVFVDGSHNLVFSNNGVPQVICSPTSGCNATAIGAPVGGGLFQSVLFVDSAGDLAQDNAHFNFNPSTDVLTVTAVQADAIAGGLFVNGDGAGASTFLGLFQQNGTLSTALDPTQIAPIIGFRSHVWNSTTASDTTGILSLIDDPISGPTPYDKFIIKNTYVTNHHMMELSDGTTDPASPTGISFWNLATTSAHLSPASGGSLTINSGFSDGVFLHNVEWGSPSSGVWMHIHPGDPSAYEDFYETLQSTINGDGSYDDVESRGFNCGPGGGIAIAGKTAFCIKHESHYEPDPFGRPGFFQAEWHAASYNLSGLENRVFSVTTPEVSTSPSPSPASGATAQLYIDAYSITMGIGLDANAPAAVAINPTESHFYSPSGPNGGLTMLLDDNTQEITIRADSLGNFAQLIESRTGQASLEVSGLLRLGLNGGVGFELGTDYAEMCQPSSACWNRFQADSNGAYLYVGNTAKLAAQASATYTTQTIRPAADSDATLNELGADGGRFNAAYIGGLAANQGSCTLTSAGKFMVVFDTNNHLDVCGCAGASCSWFTLHTW